MWQSYIAKRGPLSPYLRQELLTKLTLVASGIKNDIGNPLRAEDVMPWLKPEEPEATPEDVMRMFGVKKDG